MKRHMMHPYMRIPKQQPEEINLEDPDEMLFDSSNLEENNENINTEKTQKSDDKIVSSPEEQPQISKETESVDVQGILRDERLRMAADMDNFKKRLMREHQEQMRYASEKVLSDLLPALDNLNLAIQYGSTHEACKDMLQGIELTRKQLLDVVERNGLVAVGVRGEPFNPSIHEAIGVANNPELEKGAVSQVMQQGYKLNDRLLRPAKVFVNN